MKWNELKTKPLSEIVAWAAAQDWGRCMAECQQDQEWHSEGDVWTHTMMVCEQLEQLDEWGTRSETEKLILIFTALFHDSAKPLTSQVDPESGRVTSPKHAVKGEHLARRVLRELGCDIALREEISRLVRYHGRPAFLFERSNPDREVVHLSWLVNHELLYQFAMADTRGRLTESMTRPEENLHYWKLTAQENRCFGQPYPFGNPQARFQFYRSAEPDLHYVPHEDYRCTVTMMSGLPGSGKDHWLSLHRAETPIVSLDEIRRELSIRPTENQGQVVQVARERCREWLRDKTSFGFNATNLLRSTRKRWLDLFSDYGARIEIVYVEPDFQAILKQNRERSESVPENVILSLADKCEPPTWTEAHDLLLVD